jgi:hypothetical protein
MPVTYELGASEDERAAAVGHAGGHRARVVEHADSMSPQCGKVF